MDNGLQDQALSVQLSLVPHQQLNQPMVMLELALPQRLMAKHVPWHATVDFLLLLDLWSEHVVLLEPIVQSQPSFVQPTLQLQQQLPQLLQHLMQVVREIQTPNQPMVMLVLALPQRIMVKHAQWLATVATLFLLAV
jgi:hypothetical protein